MTAPGLDGSAVSLVRALGLLVDGPVRWGSRVGSERPGIYVVEWPRPEERAPIDHNALRAWLERVPTLRLDGLAPTPHDLAARLGSFWVPGATLVYVGTTSRSLRNRAAAQAATPLGERRPFSGGYWLKALHGFEEARIWWAETEAAEEYADALLDAFAARSGQPGTLPYANLDAPGGRRRQHGLSGALHDEAADGIDPARAGTGTRTSAKANDGLKRASGPSRSGGAGARASGSRPGGLAGSAARRTRKPTPVPPAAGEPTYLSAEGLGRITAELADLREVQRPQVIARVKSARELGDLRENAEYHAAREEQSFLEGRIIQLQAVVDRAVVVEAGAVDGRVALGSTVEVEPIDGGDRLTITIVGTAEADSRAARVSDRSPMGQALLGHADGDEVAVNTPGGERRYVIRGLR